MFDPMARVYESDNFSILIAQQASISWKLDYIGVNS